MYKVLLVDDESLIREAISENIKWNDLGFELIGACENGRQAIERIKEDTPDLLITDICMPFVDGMELTKYVYENYESVKVIIISGYDEFEYAKTAVKYHVLEYVLKPVTSYELSELLANIKEGFDREAAKNRSLKKIREAYMSNLSVLKGRFLNALIQGTLDERELKNKQEEFNIDLFGRYFVTAVIETDDLDEYIAMREGLKEDLVLFAVYNITDEIVNDYRLGAAFQNGEDKTVIVFRFDNEEGFRQKINKVCSEIKDSLNKYLELETTIGIGKTVSAINQLGRSLDTAKSVLEYRFLFGKNIILDADSLDINNYSSKFDISSWSDKIIIYIKAGNKEEIKAVVDEFVKELKSCVVPKNIAVIYIQNIVLSILNMLDNMGLGSEELIEGEYKFINNIYNHKHLEKIKEEFTLFCIGVSESMLTEKDSYSNKQAVMALDYIDKNYGNPEISLNSVCSYLSISTSYFSSIFKSYTGITFIEALTKKRIDKAKSLIENTSLKSYEIADEVGFSDPHYFSITFKKHTGCTPTEYSKKKRAK